jgi:hypothetical protein
MAFTGLFFVVTGGFFAGTTGSAFSGSIPRRRSRTSSAARRVQDRRASIERAAA